ncbi:MAG: hypothetical protein Q4E47_01660 [Candidatus Saccharibacteria bacterium]|nr:hypothetical protein [Candidatus Saccharibacteria bacterium]
MELVIEDVLQTIPCRYERRRLQGIYEEHYNNRLSALRSGREELTPAENLLELSLDTQIHDEAGSACRYARVLYCKKPQIITAMAILVLIGVCLLCFVVPNLSAGSELKNACCSFIFCMDFTVPLTAGAFLCSMPSFVVSSVSNLGKWEAERTFIRYK